MYEGGRWKFQEDVSSGRTSFAAADHWADDDRFTKRLVRVNNLRSLWTLALYCLRSTKRHISWPKSCLPKLARKLHPWARDIHVWGGLPRGPKLRMRRLFHTFSSGYETKTR